MATGPGKYDEAATQAMLATGARVVVLAVLNGYRGSGFSVQTETPLDAAGVQLVADSAAATLPGLLRSMADQIEADVQSSSPRPPAAPPSIEIERRRKPDQIEADRDRLREALRKAIAIANLARREWDAAPEGARAGKLLIALSGLFRGYRDDIDEIHNALAASDRVAAGPSPLDRALMRP